MGCDYSKCKALDSLCHRRVTGFLDEDSVSVSGFLSETLKMSQFHSDPLLPHLWKTVFYEYSSSASFFCLIVLLKKNIPKLLSMYLCPLFLRSSFSLAQYVDCTVPLKT